jgi:Acetyltransferase (GNAT) domain
VKIVARQEVGREAWDAAVDGSPEAWLWHRYDLCDTAVHGWEGRSDHSFALVEDSEVAALVPLFSQQRRSRYLVNVRHLTSNGGPALASSLGRSRRRQALDLIGAELRQRTARERAIQTTIALPTMSPALRGPSGPRCNPLLGLGCQDVSGQTWICDLRAGLEAAWNALEGRVRTNVRKAEAAGMTSRPLSEPSDWRQLYDLHLATYRRLGVASYPVQLFQSICERLVPAGLCHLQFAELNGEILAAHNVGYYKQGGYYWHGFATDAGLHSNALTFLWWQSIKQLLGAERIQWMDAGEAVGAAAQGKMRQLSDFKKGFGGELYPVFRGEIATSSTVYRRLIHLRGLIRGR